MRCIDSHDSGCRGLPLDGLEVYLLRAIFMLLRPIFTPVPMLKASFSLIRFPKTLHLLNPVDPCGFSGQDKADDLSPHLMVSG